MKSDEVGDTQSSPGRLVVYRVTDAQDRRDVSRISNLNRKGLMINSAASNVLVVLKAVVAYVKLSMKHLTTTMLPLLSVAALLFLDVSIFSGQRPGTARAKRTQPTGTTSRSSRHPAATLKVSFENHLLATIPPNASAIQFSPDGMKVAYSIRRGSKEVLVIGDIKDAEFDEVSPPQFSPDGTKLAYSVREGKKSWIVVGRTKMQEFDDAGLLFPRFSPDSRKIAYIVREGDKQRVVLDEKKGPPFDYITDLVFSPDSSKVAYVAWETLPDYDAIQKLPGGNSAELIRKDGKLLPRGKFVVVNGRRQSETFTSVRDILFNADGSQMMYLASNNFTGNDRCTYCIVVGNKWLPASSSANPVFSPDGAKIAYLGPTGVVVGDQKEPRYDGSTQRIAFSPDGRKVGYEVSRASDRSAYMVIGGNKQPDYDWTSDRTISIPVFSPNSKRVAYRIGEKGKDRVVVDGNRGPIVDWVSTPAFSPDSKKVAYLAKRNGKKFIAVIDEEGLEQDGSEFDEHYTQLVFSPDSAKVACGVRLGSQLWWKVMRLR